MLEYLDVSQVPSLYHLLKKWKNPRPRYYRQIQLQKVPKEDQRTPYLLSCEGKCITLLTVNSLYFLKHKVRRLVSAPVEKCTYTFPSPVIGMISTKKKDLPLALVLLLGGQEVALYYDAQRLHI